jgi:hypothetical protein
MTKEFSFRTSLLVGLFLITACGSAKDADKIADAQNCLNNAAPAPSTQAQDCVSKVDGIQSSGAYLIRCVAKFAYEGFNDPAKIANALTSISSGSGATSSLSLMAALAFKAESSTALNFSSIQETLGFCQKADSKGLVLLAGLSQAATSMAYFAGLSLTNLTGSDLAAQLNSLKNDPNATAAVGAAVSAIYTTSCTNGTSGTGSFCTQFGSAANSVGGTTNTAALGAKVLQCYQTPTGPGCEGF